MTPFCKRLFPAIALALMLQSTGIALAAGKNANWSLRVWHADSGLPDNNVTGVTQTTEGYLWVSTHSGLARFDGVRFVQWPLPVASGGSNLLVRELMLGNDNSLWVALEVDLGMVIGMSERYTNVFNGSNGVPNCKPLAITQTPDGAVWVGYVDGTISSFSRGVGKRFGTNEGLTGSGGCWVTADAAGTVWFAKGGQVGIVSNEQFIARFTLPANTIRIGKAIDGGLWLLAGHKLYKSAKDKEPVFLGELKTQNTGVEPSTIYEDRSGGVWLGTRAGGLFHWDGQEVVRVETSHNDITSVMEDREGNIWVGTEGGGLDRLRNQILELHGVGQGTGFEVARSVCEDDSGTIWATGANGALSRFIDGHWSPVHAGDGWLGARATCVANDHHGGVWIGTYHGGLFHWHDGRYSPLTRADGLAGETEYSLLADTHGDLWIGFENVDCLQRLRDGKLQTYLQPADSRTIRTMAEDAAGNIWLGTVGGFLLRVDGDKLIDDTTRALQPAKPIRSLHATPDGGLWIGYANGGLGWLRKGKFSQFTTDQGLLDNNICGIESDDNHALWFTSSHGVFQIREREFEMMVEGMAKRLLAVDFGRDEALLNLQGSFGFYPSTMHGHDGRLWFAMRSGLVVAQPDRLQPHSIPPVVMIERLLVDDRPLTLPKNGHELRVPPGFKKLEVKYTALNFAAPESLLFRHQFEGWDEDWSEPAADRSVIFPRLPAGKYEFQVTARNAAGVWNPQGAKFGLEIEPFLWQRWWFILILVTASIAALIAIVRYLSFRRLQHKLARLEQEAQLHNDRARIALDLHDDLGANLTQIALLSELAQNSFDKPAESRGHIDQIFRTAKSLARSLDAIVWEVNPKNDSLDRFVAHLCTYAPEFLHVAGIRCRLDVPVEVPAIILPSDVRHHLHLSVKEALHNVVKHAGASEVRLSLQLREETLSVVIEDNGKGIKPESENKAGHDGLWNFRERMAEIGGRFEHRNSPEGGACLIFTVPLRAGKKGRTKL